MQSWHICFDKEISIQTQNYFHSFQVSIPESSNLLRWKITNNTVDLPIDSSINKSIFQQYCDHTNVDNSKQELIRPGFPEIARNIFQQSYYLHLYDAQGVFRGRWNNNVLDWMEVKDKFLPEGEWTIVAISTFFPQVTINLHMQIEIIPLQTKSPSEPPLPFPQSDTEDMQQERWYIGELHEHPPHHQSNMDFRIIQRYEKLGYQFLAYSEHDKGIDLTLCPPFKMCVLPSHEIRTPQGHAMIFGVQDFLAWYFHENMLSLRDILHETHRRKGLFCMLHPYAAHPQSSHQRWIDEEEWLHIDLLEIWTGAWSQRFPEIFKTFDLWNSLLNKGIRIYGTCGKGSSITMSEDTVEQLPKTVVYSEGLTETHILSALKQGRFYSTREPAISFWTESEHGGAMMGDELRLPVGGHYLLRIQISQMDRGYMRIYTNEGIYCEMPISSTHDTDQKFIETCAQEIRWFRLEIFQYSRPLDELIAFTNPIFIRGITSVS